MEKQDWDDVFDILYDGTKEEIRNTKCPNCGGVIAYRYCESVNSFQVTCGKCMNLIRASGSPKPNCALFFWR